MSHVERIGPAAPPTRVLHDDVTFDVQDVSEFARHFLAIIERGDDRGEQYYEKDPRAGRITAALARVGVTRIKEIIGYGSFGVAATTTDERVVKLTGDITEVQVGAALIGKNLAHVVHVYGSWFIRDVDIQVEAGWNEKDQEIIYKDSRAGILIEQRIRALGPGPDRESLSNFVYAWRSEGHHRFMDYVNLSAKAKRARLEVASVELEKQLNAEATTGRVDGALFHDVARALGELRRVGIFAIDVHGGNVGFDERAGHYRIFDVGVGSPPVGGPRPKVVGPADTQTRHTTVRREEVATRRETAHELADAIALPMSVMEI